MSDHKSSRHEYRHRRRRFQTLGQWENEGGSVCQESDDTQSSSSSNGADSGAVYTEPESALLDALPLGILVTNIDGEITHSNPAFQNLFGASASELLGTHWCQVIDERDREITLERWQDSGGGQGPLTLEVRMITRSGEHIWARHSIASLAPKQAARGFIHTIEDISTIKASEQAVKAAQEALSQERERARVTLESIGDAVISTDAKGRVTYLNAVAEDLTGWAREGAFGEAFSQVFKVVDADTGEPARNPAERAMESLDIVEIPENCLLLRPDGSELAIEDSAAPILDAEGRLTGAVVIFRDRKMSRESTAKMAHLARHDALTGLCNRVSFAEHFKQAINLARRHENQVGLLFIDLDNFKQINDSLGHKAGDRLLRNLSRILISCVRNTDLVCRYGGDEFVVMLSEINRLEDAATVAVNIRAAAAKPIQVQGHLIGLELSIGISLYPENGADLEALVHRADAAMYHAKFDGGHGYCFYEAGMERPNAESHPEDSVNVTQHTDARNLAGR
ncbi:diguanylate cyclase [Wenzhouxiangella sp. XN201]|uniref:diguanylate cyclase domain-containing protein n=1 Tax=Wenzhouxiangella sp. XN201 TaxID=2710755 RepID=UPI0013C61C94|nr:diguanylate cyclase [Wenzhouxiangella sp. XN201]NEZ05018.1 diguanylate cyclase [Wenzhouxiangella sp. XN201]